MALSFAGNGTITGLSVGGLPDGCIASADIASGVIPAGGKILQAVSATKTDTATTNSTTWVDISGLSVTTGALASTSSKVLITVMGSGNGAPGADFASFRALRGSTAVGVGGADGSRLQIGSTMYENNSSAMDKYCFQFVDEPNSVSAQTYKVQWRINSSSSYTIYLNRSSGDPNSTAGMRSISTISAMEISA